MDALLPGQTMIEEGLEDLAVGRETVNALLVSMAPERLAELGYSVSKALADPELKLYERLAGELGDGAHSRYNALRRQLASFLRAAACARPSTREESESS